MVDSGKEDFESLVRLVGNVMDAFTAAFFLSDGTSGDLKLFTYFSLGNNINSNASFKPGEGMLGWVAKEQKPLTVKEFSHDTTTLKLYKQREDIKSLVAMPVLDDDRLIGVLTVDSKRQYLFTPKDQKILKEFANAIAQAVIRFEQKHKLQNDATCIETMETLVKELSCSTSMAEVVKTLYGGLHSVINHSHLLFALKSADEGFFHLVPKPSLEQDRIEKISHKMDHSLMGWVMKNNQPLNHHDLSEHPNKKELGAEAQLRQGYRSFLGVPMVVGRQVIGALGLFSRFKNDFNQRDVKLLSILGSIAASHVAGAHIYGMNLASQKIDSLTGLGNYLYMIEKMEELGPEPGALLTIDICNFSRITNEFSIEVADMALVEIAKFLKRIVGEEGIVCRYYGDVFLTFLYDHDREKAFLAARKLADVLRAKSFYVENQQVVFESRIGIAVYPDDGRNGNDLIKNSFAALKRSQSGGVTGKTVT